jgi:cell wall-associated NlpC family hydrolase
MNRTVPTFTGTPYKESYDATGPDYYDCSGAIIAAIRKIANPKFGRYTADDLYYKYTTPLSEQGGPGTLIFYNNKLPPTPDRIDHVVTYVGNGLTIGPNGKQGSTQPNKVSYEGDYTASRKGTIYYAQINWDAVMSEQ